MNGNWVVYNQPAKKAQTEDLAELRFALEGAPKECLENLETGEKYGFGTEVPMTCCTRGPQASETGFTARQASTRGYCAPSPANDPNVGEQTAQDTLAFCHTTNPMGGMAVYGEFCGEMNAEGSFESNGCKPC